METKHAKAIVTADNPLKWPSFDALNKVLSKNSSSSFE